MGVVGKIRAVYLDRDGVINNSVVVDGKPYPPATLEEMVILPGVKEGIGKLKDNRFMVFVVTNQPDVGRGKTKLEEVIRINDYLQEYLHIDHVYSCFHDGIEVCECRKPKPGMLLQAAERWNIDLSRSYMIGDRWRDIEAGISAGVATILIDYNYDEKRIEPDFTAADFTAAVDYILNQ